MLFRVLGSIEAAAGGQTADVGRGRRRTILAVLLAARGDTVSTEALIDAVWGARPPASARKSLQSHVSRLRGRLARMAASPPPLTSVPDGYRLDLRGHDLDAARFEALAAEGRQLRTRAPARALERLDEALALWTGSAFGELASHPAIRPEAARLEQLRAATTADRVDALLALGRHDEVAGELERTVQLEPLSERPHGQLMLARYRGGRQGDALEVYRCLRERLRDELGLDPSPAIRDLHARILHQEPAMTGPTSGDSGDRGLRHRAVPRPEDAGAEARPDGATAARRTDGSTPARVGLVPPKLVGRDEEVVGAAERVAPGDLLTLTGPGGVGKTRLAEQVAARVAERFADGVAVAALAGVRDPASVGEALVTALGIQPTGERTTTQSLVAALAERQLLLLLDNCEHVLGGVAPLVEAILGRCPNVAVLATSRERLHLPGERLWPVAPLPVPDRDADADEVAATPAGALFELRAAATEPGFRLTRGNAPAVAELCRRLDGMPLAIELAAARVRALTPQDLVDRLDQRFSLLAGGPRHEAGRHRTLQAVVAWSHDLLDDDEARVFDRLSVFAGTFSLAAAESVCAGDGIDHARVAALMGELVDKSMVVVDRRDPETRYRMLDTLREYGTRHLSATDDPDRWRRAHATYHLALAERLGPRVRGPDEAAAVTGIDAAFDDLRAAQAWLVDAGDTDGALRIPAALGDYLFYRLRDEVTTWARRAVALPGATARAAHAAALTTAAAGATSRAECPRARREAEQALRHAAPDSWAVAWALGALGTAALYEGRLDDLLEHAADLVRVAERLQTPFYVGFAGVLRVIGHTYRDEPTEALDALADLDAAADASGSPTMVAFARYCRGEVLLESAPAAAADALEEAVRLARQVANGLVEGVSTVSLASQRGRMGQTREALQLFRHVVRHWRRLGDDTHQLTTLRNLVMLLARIGADEPAATLHGAVTTGPTPSFGLEAQRLEDAWAQLQARMGPAAAVCAARGRDLSPTQMSELALSHLDQLLSVQVPAEGLRRARGSPARDG